MKHIHFLVICALICAIIFVTSRWIGKLDPAISRITLIVPNVTTMIPVQRQSVTLNDGEYDYHLDLSRFYMEFPYMQTYQCSVILSPPVARFDDGNSSLIVMAVKSPPGSGARRSAIRQTWAKDQRVEGYKMKHLFLVGRTKVSGEMELVKVESDTYGDILQWDITEEHHNLSLKERCFLEWLHHNLPGVAYVYKGDDDVFVNKILMVDLLKNFGSPDLVHGFHNHRPNVIRGSKYRVSEALYPMTFYPGFVSGGGFIFSGPSVHRLYEASLVLPVFPLDDVYFGFLILASNLTYRHDARFRVHGLRYDNCNYMQAIVVHGVVTDELIQVWKKMEEEKCDKTNSSRVQEG
ncbi:hypothetical protein GDO81_028056 [Engystomops pustulosus]|uniref:Hexosyltransferase n=1 Tax=Engystomops pustulosus TaxID=76066 RepID=A0AAV6YNQ7_ENGPU|nr:hypothetical protein GDO81_028056 [Engystomops pustulosus]